MLERGVRIPRPNLGYIALDLQRPHAPACLSQLCTSCQQLPALHRSTNYFRFLYTYYNGPQVIPATSLSRLRSTSYVKRQERCVFVEGRCTPTATAQLLVNQLQ